MLPPVVKLYLFGTLVSVLALLYEMLDSFGGLMYVQEPCDLVALEERAKAQQGRTPPCSRRSGGAAARGRRSASPPEGGNSQFSF